MAQRIKNLPAKQEPWFVHLNSGGFPGGSEGKESACKARALVLIPESGRSPGEGNGYPLQSSRRENSMERGAWRATVRGIPESDTTE